MSDKVNRENFLPFAAVTLADKTTVDKYMQPFGQSSCQHSFTALFTLREKYGSEICERDGFLFTLRQALSTEDERVYLAPMGEGDRKSAYGEILGDAAAHGCRAVFQTLTKEQAVFLKKNFPGRFDYTELRDFAEYIYLADKLSVMAGKKFADKRNKVNNIIRVYGERLEAKTLTPNSVSDIWEFEKSWFENNASTHDADALAQEMQAIRLQLDNFKLLELSGVGIYIDGKMVAFAYGVPLNGRCFDGLIAKARRDIPNLYKLLFWEISCLCADCHTYFNWEEDVGVTGLRNMKMEYGPVVLMRKYLAREKDIPSDIPESETIPMLSDVEVKPYEELIPASLNEL